MAAINIIYYGFVLAWVALLLYKVRHLSANRRNPRQWAVCAAIFFPALALSLAAPATTLWIDRVTGIPNITQVPIGIASNGTGASWLCLALFWRHPAAHAWPRARWVLVVYGLNSVVMAVLFGISDVPEEHPHLEFANYYVPRQLTVFVYELFFLVAAAAGVMTLAVWCTTWSRSPDYAEPPWLRRGLFLIGLCGGAASFYYVVQVSQIIALRLGTSVLDGPIRLILAAMLLLNIVLFPLAIGFAMLGPRWPAIREWLDRWRAFHALRPLHRALRHVDPSVMMVARERRRDPRHRVRRMMIELSDWRVSLVPLFDPALGELAECRGREAGLTGARLEAAVEAAQLSAAVEAWRRGARPEANSLLVEEEPQDGSGTNAEITWWVEVSRAFQMCRAARETPARAVR